MRGSALAAVHVIVPEGWSVDGGVDWRPQSSTPAEVRLSVHDAAGRAFQLLPQRAFAWRFADDPASPRPLPPGGPQQLPPFGDAVVFIERIVVPELHGGASAIEVLAREPLPAVARVVAASGADAARRDVSAARVRVRTSERGEIWDEDIYCVLVQTRAPAAGEEMIQWGPERLYLLRAHEGQLDAENAVLQSIASSYRLDATWTARYRVLLDALEHRVAWTSVGDGELGAFLERARIAEVDGRGADAAEAEALRTRVNAVLAAHFGKTETFFDPRNEREVLLPRGYARAWASARGDYLVTVDPDLDLRAADADGDWAELHAVSAR